VRRQVFARVGLRVASSADLRQPLRDEHLRWLAEEERRDVAYHRPERVGDVLFNWFD
jgi:hypothetical protein